VQESLVTSFQRKENAMPDDDREQRFERALAQHLGNVSPDSACPDAELLAAYHQRTLSAEEMARSKEHIASCSRCQEVLALVEQTDTVAAQEPQNELFPVEVSLALPVLHAAGSAREEAPKAAVRAPAFTDIARGASKTRPRAAWHWIVPVGAIAAAVIVWIGVQEVRTQRRQQTYEAQLAQNRMSMPQLPPPKAEPRATPKRELPAAKQEKTIPEQKKAVGPPPKGAAPETDSALQASGAVASSTETVARNQQEHVGGGSGGGVAPKPSAAIRSGLRTSADDRAQASHGKAKPATDEKEESADAVRSVESVQAQPSASSLDSTSAPVQAQANFLKAGGLLQIAAGDPHFVVAPGEGHAWHLGIAGQISHTTDHGRTWQPQSSGVTADLIAGSATSDQVCWVVGKAGTLLLTTDGGKHWKPLSSPISDDLGGVHASDAMHASIWDVPNRRSYQTSDGGLTWQRSANE
jgi:photosynthesis system II assembly factor YCF48-like protein